MVISHEQKSITLLKYPMPVVPTADMLKDANLMYKYLFEFSRTIEENFRLLTISVSTLEEKLKLFTDLHIAIMVSTVSPSPYGIYLCSITKYNLRNETEAVVTASGQVTDLIDNFHGENTLLVGDKIICWKISDDDDPTPLWVGVQYFGRSTIGLP